MTKNFIQVNKGASLTLTHSYSGVATKGGFKRDASSGFNGKWNGSLFDIQGGTMVLRTDVSNFRTTSAAAVVANVDSNGALTINEATISDCSSNNNESGSIICVIDGNLNFKEGTISHCSVESEVAVGATSQSGIIYLHPTHNNANASAVIDEKSRIINCSGKNASALLVENHTSSLTFKGEMTGFSSTNRGVPIEIIKDGNVTMENPGKIVNSNCQDVSSAVVMGIRPGQYGSQYQTNSFTMNGGTIDDSNISSSLQGAIYVGDKGKFTMNDGTITVNQKSTSAGCVFICEEATMTMNGGTLKGHKSASLNKGGLIYNKGTFTMNKGTLDGSDQEVTQGGLIYSLKTNSSNSSPKVYVYNGTLINGLALDTNTGDIGQGGAIWMNGGTLCLGDGSDASRKLLIENCSADTAGGAICVNGGHLQTAGNVCIKNCSASFGGKSNVNDTENANHIFYGGAICLNSASYTLGGKLEITQCSAGGKSSSSSTNGFGGALYLGTIYKNEAASGSSDKISISQCHAKNDGGAIYVATSPQSGKTNIALGNIELTQNTAGRNGGALYVANGNRITINGTCKASSNSADNAGGGMYLVGVQAQISGTTEVSQNKAQNYGGGIALLPSDGSASNEEVNWEEVEASETQLDDTSDTQEGTEETADSSEDSNAAANTNMILSGSFTIKNNTSQNATTKKDTASNLFFDYLAQSSTTSRGSCGTINCDVSSKDLKADIGVSVTTEALTTPKGLDSVVISQGGWEKHSFFSLDNSDQVFVTNDDAKDLRVTRSERGVKDFAGLQNAVKTGGDYFILNDIDLSRDSNYRTLEVSTATTFNMMGHWITFESRRGSLFKIVNGGRLVVGSVKVDNPSGGLRGTAKDASSADYKSSVIVQEGGSFTLRSIMENCAGTTQETTAAAIHLGNPDGGGGPGPIELICEGAIIRNCYGKGSSAIMDSLDGRYEYERVVLIDSTIEGVAEANYGSCFASRCNSLNLIITGSTLQAKKLGFDEGRDTRLRGYGGCLYVRGVRPSVSIKSSTLEGTGTDYEVRSGGIVYIDGKNASLDIQSSTLKKGRAIHGGGGIYAACEYLSLSEDSSITDCSVSSECGGGISWAQYDTIPYASENESASLSADDSANTEENSTTGASEAAAVSEESNASENAALSDDTSSNSGNDRRLIIKGTIQNCSASSALGGALYISNMDFERNTKVYISGSLIGNSADDGGAIMLDGTVGGIKDLKTTTVELTSDAKLCGNSARHDGGAICLEKGTVIVNGTIRGNSANNGGAIFAVPKSNNKIQLTLTDKALVANNTAGVIGLGSSYGGGICVVPKTGLTEIKIEGKARVVNNTAQGDVSNLYLATGSQVGKIELGSTFDNFGRGGVACPITTDGNYTGVCGISFNAGGVSTWPLLFGQIKEAELLYFVPDEVSYDVTFAENCGALAKNKLQAASAVSDDSQKKSEDINSNGDNNNNTDSTNTDNTNTNNTDTNNTNSNGASTGASSDTSSDSGNSSANASSQGKVSGTSALTGDKATLLMAALGVLALVCGGVALITKRYNITISRK